MLLLLPRFRSCPTLPPPGSSCCLVPALRLSCSYSATALLLPFFCSYPAPAQLLPLSSSGSCPAPAPALLILLPLPSSCPVPVPSPTLSLLLPTCSYPAPALFLLLPCSCPSLPCFCPSCPCCWSSPAFSLLQLLPTQIWQTSSSSAPYNFFGTVIAAFYSISIE